ncbi:MAG: isocitrate lyase/phosphoenolpyruvate mutase family protein [Alphaproteobacteria bacterium]|nr:isocitrate lyase/phosphoenolpyruvate mutase family protein [Alphaproteobacteria bacterium]MBL7096381.1 isocitrate lyase/phosphoenolpyruvate mutase family protein [Alphaproteobacteria bacterium]
MTIHDRAKAFAALHAGPKLLVLPNAWDAGSARVIQHAGASAIATSSAAVAWAHGYADGQHLPWETLLHTVSEIVKTVTVPVSADIEAAYAHDAATAATTVGQVIEAGAVGINIEDGNDSPDLLAKKIENLRAASRKLGVDIWVNARIDTYLRRLVEGEAAYPETVRRAKLYREAGASSIFVPGFPDSARIAELVKDVVLPLNLLAWPGLLDGAALENAGVRRLSAGSGIGKVVLSETFRLAKDFLANGSSEPLVQGALTNADINGMLRKG